MIKHLARWGLARVAAANGERIPLPEFRARRSDLFEIRGGPGDARIRQILAAP